MFSSTKYSRILTGTLLLIYLSGALFYLSKYFVVDFNTWVGLGLAPLVLVINRKSTSQRFAIPFIAAMVLAFVLPLYTSLFLAFLFGVLFFTESCIGKLNLSFVALLFVISPIFFYLSNSIGLPLRLWLSEIVSDIFKSMGNDASAVGNLIVLNNEQFSVDTACAGLKMMSISFLVALFLISHHQKVNKTEPGFFRITIFLLITLALNIFCNLFRIILLVSFRIMPENPFHDVIGMVSLIAYVIVPLYFLSKLLFRKNNVTRDLPGKTVAVNYFKLAVHGFLVAALLLTGTRTATMSAQQTATVDYNLEGFDKELLKSGVFKFYNKDALIYFKPMKVYAAEHSPAICWTGGGYEFDLVKKEMVSGYEIYTGIIKNDDGIIHTAWWFDNGTQRTINQLDWRWSALQGKGDFALINVNASSRAQLIKETEKLIQRTSKSFNNEIALQ